MVQVASDLLPKMKEELCTCLFQNRDVFAWTREDFTSISPSVAVHRLNIAPDAYPVKQKRRHFGPEQNKVIRVEVQKLLAAGHIKEVQFPTWLSNVVLVPKPGNRWRVCVDFRDLNKACPKDCYPLPRIDQMVDSTAGRWRSAERSFPFFKVLKKAQRFHWNAECDRAFEELKNYLSQLPRLAKALPVEPLWMYLSATEVAVSSVLVKEEEKSQHPIYFFSRRLKDAETRILTQPEASGRLIKWTVELGEYDIRYEPRAAIKAQALADFLSEISREEAEEEWKVYVDGASNKQGSGVGVLLLAPTGEEVRLAIRLGFKASNNEAEYEAALVGLQAARRMGATRISLYSDSQLVSQQVEGSSLSPIRTDDTTTTHIAAVAQIDQLPATEKEDWRTPIRVFLETETTPVNPDQARLLKRRASRFTLIEDQLYRRSFSKPLLKCLGPEDADYVLREAHLGCCGDHPGSRSLARKILLAGYFWPTLQKDATELVNTCVHCQKYQPFGRRPTEQLKAATTSCPFDQWGLDIVGPLPMGPQQKKFLLVAVDYFSKWVEAEALSRITEGAVMKFLWGNIVCRYGIPYRLVSDNGRQFSGKKLREWCQGLSILQAFTSVAYPQANGQAEVINREIIKGLEKKLDHEGGSWVDELPSVLWSYRTTPRESTGMTPFHLVYGGEAVVPIEVGVQSYRRQHYGEDNGDKRLLELDLVSEARDKAATRLTAYRQRMCCTYNKKVISRTFQVGDFVWKRAKPVGDVGKLEPPWEGPYRITKKTSTGSYYLADAADKELKRPWNVLYLRPYRI
ncbi:uncharacterized protein LOC141829917 [Curcuma longa]|uniref:uncharacterized protein LOC141829917 n=1 Tax=Curcuma longa TaxID=136217 RepID=UPI003D9DEB7E